MDYTKYWASATSTADLGEEISQSLRFQESGYLKRAQSSSGDGLISTSGRIFTFSTWFKHGDMGETQIFGIHPSSSDNWILAWTTSTRGFAGRDGTGYTAYNTTREYNDPNAWYHLFVTCSAGVLTLYVNGVQGEQTDTQNHSMDRDFILGAENGNGGTPMDGYLAETYFIQGTVLHPVNDGFIRLNEDGVYVPDTPTISSYGTNGWHLTYDSSQTNGIGHDSSGNGNHFTASGFQTTSTHENYDLDYNDTPTSNYATLNALRSTVTTGLGAQDANLTLDGTDENWAATPGSCAQNSGVRFFEMEISSSGSGPNNNFIGFASADCRFNISALQDDSTEGAKGRILLCDDGQTKLDNAARQTYTSNIAASNVIGCLIDFDDEEVTYYRDGTSLGAIDISSSPLVDGRMVVPVNIVIGSPHNTHDQYLNYGQRAFHHAPTGVTAANNGFQTNNLPEPTIKNGKDHFDVLLYTGNGTDSHAITGLDFQPDLVWIKPRSVADNHRLIDSVRGVTTHLIPNSTDGEPASNAQILESLDSGGFTLNTDDAGWNGNTSTYVAWCWKAGGTAVSNTDGTITSSVSANTDAGFSIVSYTGTGANATVGHGLNSAPECIIVKSRDSAANWEVKHVGLSSNDHMLKLNATDAEEDLNSWNNTAPTSSVFSLGAANGTIKSGDDFIAYCWHSVEGYSKFGFYTGNGSSTDQPFVYLGFTPALLIMKRVDGTSNWHLRDTTRATSNPDELWIEADNSAQEQTNNAGYRIDHLSNGFKWKGSVLGTSGSKYMYMAWARNPFGGENAPPATAR